MIIGQEDVSTPQDALLLSSISYDIVSHTIDRFIPITPILFNIVINPKIEDRRSQEKKTRRRKSHPSAHAKVAVPQQLSNSHDPHCTQVTLNIRSRRATITLQSSHQIVN